MKIFNKLHNEEPTNWDGTPLKQIKTLDDVVPVDEPECPGCGEEIPEFYGAYYKGNDGLDYPSFLNYEEYFNGDINVIRFDEVHRCDDCNIIYTVENGN